MKKLMFALVAGVAATVATAAPITQSDFESYTAGDKPTAADRFGYVPSNTSEDSSVVKAYDAEVTAYAGDRNAAFGSSNYNYLELNTDGGVLYRSINDLIQSAPTGEAVRVESSLYIDTLVQFTVCDSAPEIDSGAKLAIWLQASDDETTTNLMVKANHWTVSKNDGVLVGTCSPTGRVYTINSAPGKFKAGEWYRLTVEDLGNVFTAEGYGATGFRIKVDGYVVRSAYGSSFHTTNNEGEEVSATEVLRGLVKGVVQDYTSTAEIFMSLADTTLTAPQEGYKTHLSAVGFSGTGAVDDILFTSEDPYFKAPTTLDFTLALNTNVISSVTYSINNAAGVTVNDTTVLDDVPVGATIELTSITTKSAEWQTFSATVAAGDNATVSGTTVTLKAGAAFLPTDENLETASATVSADANAPTNNGAVATFLVALGLNSTLAEKFTTIAAYNKLLGWVAANSYTKSDVNAYEYSYERSQLWTGEENTPNYAIEMPVYVATNANVAAFSATVDGNAVVGEAFVDPTDANITGVKYMVEAGKDLVVTVSEFADAGAGKAYLLNGDTEDSDWIVPNADHDGTLSVNGTSNVVTLATSYEAPEDWFALATVEVSTYVPVYYTAVTLNKNATSLVTNETETLTATFTPASAADDTYTWASDDTSVATVEGGVVTAVGAGTATITVTATHDTTVTASCTVTVTAPVYYESISLKASTSLVTNTTETLVATLTPAEAADDSVTWTSSAPVVATVDQNGVVTAVAAGEATITAATKNYSATCTVTVTAPEPTPELPVIPAGGETAEYASAEAAAEVAAAVNASEEAKAKAITPPASVAEGDKSTYYSYVQAVTAGNKVTVGFTTAGEAAARASANAATADADFSAAISDAAAAGASGSGTASVSSEPGLYYSIMSTGSLSTEMTEGARVPGNGGTINLTVPNKGAAGFYKVKVSPRAAD